jgi:hypothetical protein
MIITKITASQIASVGMTESIFGTHARVGRLDCKLATLVSRTAGLVHPADLSALCYRLVKAGGIGQPMMGHALWIGSIQATVSGFSSPSMSRLTTTASLSLRMTTHSSGSSGLALIS